MRSTQFQTKVAEVETMFGRPDSVKLIQAGLYLFVRGSLSLADLSRSVKAVAAYHSSHFTDSVPASVPVLKQLLKEVNKFLPDPLLRLWVTRCSPYFHYKDQICPREFLFLAASAKNRAALISNLPYGQMCVHPGSDGTFPLDDIARSPAHPDFLLETQAAKNLVLDKVHFIGNSEARPMPTSASQRISLHDFMKELSRQSQKEQLRKTLEDSQQKLNAVKLGGRLAYEERYCIPIRQSLSQSPKKKSSGAAPLTPQADRSAFFSNVPYTTYVPPQLLFPIRPKFSKVLRRREVRTLAESSVSLARSVNLTKKRVKSVTRMRNWVEKICK
jgi:hypothetical protein